MKKLVSYLPALLGAVTVTSGGTVSISDSDVSSIGNVMLSLGTSILDIVIKFAPFLLLFGGIIAIIAFVFNRFNR